MKRIKLLFAVLGVCTLLCACSLPGETIREKNYTIDESGVKHKTSVIVRDPETREILEEEHYLTETILEEDVLVEEILEEDVIR